MRCEYCGKFFYKAPRRYMRDKHHFCSKECYTKWMRENSHLMGRKAKNPCWDAYRKIVHLAHILNGKQRQVVSSGEKDKGA